MLDKTDPELPQHNKLDEKAKAASELALDIYEQIEQAFLTISGLPTENDFISIIKEVKQSVTDDPNLRDVVLFCALKEKIETLEMTPDEHKSVHKVLYDALISEMNIDNLSPLHQKILNAILAMQELVKPLYIGKDSEAKRNVEERRKKVGEAVSNWVASGDEALSGDLKKYLDFITIMSQMHSVTASSIEHFKSTLKHQDDTPLKYESDSMPKKVLRGMTRTTKTAMGSLITEDIETLPDLSKEQRAQIKVLHTLITKPNLDQQSIKKSQELILEQHEKQLKRESKKLSSVLKEFVLGKRNVKATMTGVYQAIKHPIAKVYEDDTLSVPQKVVKGAKILVKKPVVAVLSTIKFQVKTAAELASGAITKPVEMVAKGGLAGFNACEALGLALMAEMETDVDNKKILELQVKEKLGNLNYNARKCLEALIVSCATAVAIGTVVATSSGSLPAIAGVQAAAAAHALMVADIVDNAKSGAEFLQFVISIVTSSTAIEEHERHKLLAMIHESIQEIVEAEGSLSRATSSRSSLRMNVKADDLSDSQTTDDSEQFSDAYDIVDADLGSEKTVVTDSDISSETSDDSESDEASLNNDGEQTRSFKNRLGKMKQDSGVMNVDKSGPQKN